MYELLIQLRKAGFPQEKKEGKLFVHVAGENYNGTLESGYFKEMSSYGDIYEPTTDELIEELGDDFNFVCKHPETHLFGAETHSGIVVSSKHGEKTAKEALIRLYIELHKSKQ